MKSSSSWCLKIIQKLYVIRTVFEGDFVILWSPEYLAKEYTVSSLTSGFLPEISQTWQNIQTGTQTGFTHALNLIHFKKKTWIYLGHTSIKDYK